ncbi:MAG: flagellar hook protein FlgE [Candidatus Eisenbacteria bacterium]
MMRALFAGVSGLRSHQVRMDVIGNNIANVNTIGFKASRATFEEAFVQVLSKAQRPDDMTGGMNPVQVGTGTNVGSIDQLFTQGSLENTGQPLDLAIQGDGLFVLSNGQNRVFTRAGNFQLDANGRLVSPFSGYILQGVNADENGKFNGTAAISDVEIALGAKAAAKETSLVSLTGNLDADAEVDDTHSMGITVYDALGTPHNLQILFTNTGPGTWSWVATCDTAPVTPDTEGTVTFGTDGSLESFTYPGGGESITLTPPNAEPFEITLDPGTVGGFDGLSGFANASNAVVNSQDGYQAGDLVNVSVDSRGMVNGTFSNGTTRVLAQISLASFNNPGGLIRSGDNVYEETPNSGAAILSFAGGSASSTITPGALESSNVDVSQEFSNMIVAQRGFQANARVISTADEMLNELVNLRR